jgi:hypothetical protein
MNFQIIVQFLIVHVANALVDQCKVFLSFILKCTFITILMGLNDQFLIVCGQILLMEPLPPFNKVFSMILQDERQREVSSTKNCFTDSAAFMLSRPLTPFVPIS